MLDTFDGDWSGPSQWAAMYRSLGLQVVPAHKPGEGDQWKRPFGEWLEFREALANDAVFNRWFHPETGEHRRRNNMGLILGKASGGIVAIDLDLYKPGAAEWWERVKRAVFDGQEPKTWRQRTGGGGEQLLFRVPPDWDWTPPTFKAPPVGVDVRGQGGFIMTPPSFHSSGKPYEWLPGGEPWKVELLELPERLRDEIDTLREEHGRAPGGQPRERTAPAEGATNAFGRTVDGREDMLLRHVWGAVVDLYRESPIPPVQAVQEAEIQRVWTHYEQAAKTRLELAPGETNADGLEREGRGISELRTKWAYAMGQWDGKVREAAGEPKPERPLEDEPARASHASSATDSTLETFGEPDTSEPIDAGDFHGLPPEREWLVEEWIVRDEVNSLYGMGGLGKTLLAQQLAYTAVGGGEWAGMPVARCKAVLAVFCEDREDELHRRHDAIRKAAGHVIGNPYKGVYLWPRYGLDNTLLSYWHDKPTLGAFYLRLQQTIETLNPELLILDTIRDVYAADERDPIKVNTFLKTVLGGLILVQQARGRTLTILLLGHPSVMGQKEGLGLAGSLAWENGVRSRLYLSKPEEGGPDARTLTRGKANYASSGPDTTVNLVWVDGVLGTVSEADRRRVRDGALVEIVRDKVGYAWDAGRPYMDRPSHERSLHRLLAQQLCDGCGVSPAVAGEAIRQAIEDGQIHLSRNTGKRGWRAS
jgi:hypothetical protein